MTALLPDPEALAARERLGEAWRGVGAAVVLGSGLSAAADAFPEAERIAFADLEGFGAPKASGHPGVLSLASHRGMPILLFRGRRHYYEEGSMAAAAFPARLAAALGARAILLFSAVGSTDPALTVGSWLLVEDHVNLMGTNPLLGVSGPDGAPHVDLTRLYRADLLPAVRAAAKPLPVASGILAAFAGPTYETPAEVRMAAALGARAVGMSTVPEAVWARALGLDVLAFARVANAAAGLSAEELRHDEVLRRGGEGAGEAAALIGAALDAWMADREGKGA